MPSPGQAAGDELRPIATPAAIPEGADLTGKSFVSVGGEDRFEHRESREAAEVLVEHLFAPVPVPVPGIAYAIHYRLAEGRAGGDLVDVYGFDNASVAFTVADISGKGTRAAVQAAMVKYGLRAYASEGFNPEKVLRSLDRLYLENTAFELTESFATVFFGHLDAERSMMTYASAGHEGVVLVPPGGEPVVLDVTAPAVGVFEDQQHLFKQRSVAIAPGTLLVAVTDGITESRRGRREFFGMERCLDVLREQRDAQVDVVARTLADRALAFSDRPAHDDIAILVVRIAANASDDAPASTNLRDTP